MGLCPTMAPSTPFVQRPSFACRINQLPARKNWPCSTITVTHNEILYSLNKPEDFILGIVEFRDDDGYRVRYVRQPFQREPDFGVTSVNYDFAELLARAEPPS